MVKLLPWGYGPEPLSAGQQRQWCVPRCEAKIWRQCLKKLTPCFDTSMEGLERGKRIGNGPQTACVVIGDLNLAIIDVVVVPITTGKGVELLSNSVAVGIRRVTQWSDLPDSGSELELQRPGIG